jgi:hypothetical protein
MPKLHDVRFVSERRAVKKEAADAQTQFHNRNCEIPFSTRIEYPQVLSVLALLQKSISVVTSFVFSSCDFVDRSFCPEN